MSSLSDGPPAGRSLRVAMVCPYSLGRPGGVQGQAVGLATALRRRGHEVAVLAPAPADGGPATIEVGGDADGLGAFDGLHRRGRTRGVTSNGSVAPVTFSLGASADVVRFVRRRSADVVHLHEPFAPMLGYGALWRHPAPLVATFHRSGPSAWYRAFRPLATSVRRHIDLACAVSEAARRTAASALGGHYDVLFNGVDLDRFATAEPAPNGGRPTVLFVGRHEHRKGLAVLLEAFSAVEPPARLWVVGEGPLTKRLREAFPPSDRIEWLGAVPDGELSSYMAGADVLCAPSLGGESFGVVLLEGMAAHCAVVASDIDGYREAAGGHASLVVPGDPAALASALTRALGEMAAVPAGGRAAAGAAAAAHAERWSMARLAAAYEERYLAVLVGPTAA